MPKRKEVPEASKPLLARALELLENELREESAHPASEALQKAYKEITGRDPWLWTGETHYKDDNAYKVYAETDAYKRIKDPILKRLNEMKHSLILVIQAKESGDVYLNSKRDLDRGVDLEDLEELGPVFR